MDLHGFQKRHLRALAQTRSPAVRIGKAGLTDGVLAEVQAALLRHELVKIHWAQADDAEDAELARRTGADVVGRTGSSLLLYRPDPANPRIRLPERA